MKKISNCPDTGLERFFTHKNLLFFETTKQIILECHISHYKNEEVVENARIKSYKRDLVATNNTPVNKNTGVVLDNTEDVWNDSNTISEYNYYKSLLATEVIINNVINSLLETKDNEGKFNV